MFERLIRNSTVLDDQNENGCWAWIGGLTTNNYGQVSMRVPTVNEWGDVLPKRVKKFLAHRVMEQIHRDQDAQLAADMAIEDTWTLAGTVKAPPLDPDEETIEHLCCYRRCINIDHWITVSRAENTRLMQQRKKAK